ncbi:CDP-glycerol glycerophosphotransferase family protein [Leucobacter coleopterorum]|uniref:CDP-glycerol glycerophosphotransferase family protein n=1 Tax=Leucobacter coleopterorum TaxID=2714933 RepID=UPI00244DF155|nr:CDP-glycerol glycerophosphotransferase family protein [Leucobacter coleopterorum]
MSTGGFNFAQGNLSKLLALPKYLLSVIVSWFVPRSDTKWVFGSGIGVAEGALVVARQLRLEEPDASISWLVANEEEAEAARNEGFVPVARESASGYWATLRAGRIVVTHGLGDVNRFGIMGGCIVQLWHGAPIKRLHLDSQVTTAISGPAPLRVMLRRMYLAGSRQVSLYVAGSPLAAERLRSAFRVAPGKVRVLGDPRDDTLASQAADPAKAERSKQQLQELLAAAGSSVSAQDMLILYAPTWRDGDADPAAPTKKEVTRLRKLLNQHGAHLLIRSHPLGAGAYEGVLGERVHLLGADFLREITPLLGASTRSSPTTLRLPSTSPSWDDQSSGLPLTSTTMKALGGSTSRLQ